MTLLQNQVFGLLNMVASAVPDEMDCDNCCVRIAEFAELHVSGKPMPEAIKAVQVHLQQCLCCQDEFNALLQALQAIEE